MDFKLFLNNKFLLFICSLLLLSCTNCSNYSDQDITVFYFCGHPEFYTQIECSDLENYCNKTEYDDTIYIDCDMGKQINLVKTEDIHPPKTGISVHFCVLSLMAMQK